MTGRPIDDLTDSDVMLTDFEAVKTGEKSLSDIAEEFADSRVSANDIRLTFVWHGFYVADGITRPHPRTQGIRAPWRRFQ